MQTSILVFQNIRFKFILMFSLCLIRVNAQRPEWLNELHGGDSRVRAHALDAAGNSYLFGDVSQSPDFDAGAGSYFLPAQFGVSLRMYVAKYDSSGRLIWAKGIYASSLSQWSVDMKVNSAGQLYFTGSFTGTMDFDPGPGISNLTANASQGGTFICKWDSGGALMWCRALDAPYQVLPTALAVDAAGNLLVSGHFKDSIDVDPGPGLVRLVSQSSSQPTAFFLKLDANGNYQQGFSISSLNGSTIDALAVSGGGAYYLSGYLNGTADFDPGPGTSNYQVNPGAFLAKYDAALNLQQVLTWPGFRSKALAIGNLNTVYVGMEYTQAGTAPDADPGAGTTLIAANPNSTNAALVKLDSSGAFVYVRVLESTGGSSCHLNAIAVDANQNIILAGQSSGITDMNPGIGNLNVSCPGSHAVLYTLILEDAGAVKWLYPVEANNLLNECRTVTCAGGNKLYIGGHFSGSADFDPTSASRFFTHNGVFESYLLKFSIQGVNGWVYSDWSQDCLPGLNEMGISGVLLEIQPGGMIVQSDNSGCWYVDSLPAGNYTIRVDSSSNWRTHCQYVQGFQVVSPVQSTAGPDFGLYSLSPCTAPQISIVAPLLRPCRNTNIEVLACNSMSAGIPIINSQVLVHLDTIFSPVSASLPYTVLPGNILQFVIDTLYPGQCEPIHIIAVLSCSLTVGYTVCLEADITPIDSCALDTVPGIQSPSLPLCTSPWDNSHIVLDGACFQNQILFTIHNAGYQGAGNMVCPVQKRLFIDGVLQMTGSVQLNMGETDSLWITADGKTYRLEVDQHPLHPGNSNPEKTIELCGNPANWTPGLVNVLPPDDKDPNIDIYCGEVVASMDPNDKTGTPYGMGTQHTVLPDGEMEYVIRFQNTGTDTAMDVTILDTLDMNLDIFSVVPGASSHANHFRIYGPRVLEWSFPGIMLPDSNVNEAASHGFVSYRVRQGSQLPDGTQFENTASIYFDYNPSVVTNTTFHVVNREWLVSRATSATLNPVRVYPNPFHDRFILDWGFESSETEIEVMNSLGQRLMKKTLRNSGSADLELSGEAGLYLVQVKLNGENYVVKVLKM